MALHEKQKSAKISEEIVGYLLEKGFKKVDLSIDITDKETTFTVVLYDTKIPLEHDLTRDLYCERDMELEEYGWDFHEEQCSTMLHTLGLLVDEYTFKEVDGTYIIHFIRKC